MTYLSPGVYIEEVPSGPQPIAAAPTSVLAILGTTRKGPVLTPTRITGWADFVRKFGAPTARSFTGESVYGFFENGGPAAWVVRVDRSAAASWNAADVSGTVSFALSASSPGSWGNALSIAVAPDESGAAGSYYRATTTGATVSVTNAGNHTLQVASSQGLRAGDALVLVPMPQSGAIGAPVAATVVSVTATTIVLTASGSASMTAGSVVASASAAGATTVFLPSGKGFHVGDVIVATAPNGGRSSALVTGVAAAGSGVLLTLDSSLGAVPGAAFVQRRAKFPATANVVATATGTPPKTPITLVDLAFDRDLTAPDDGDLDASGATSAAARITTADGRTATWDGSKFDVVGPAPVNGPAMVESAVSMVLLAHKGLAITGLTAADVDALYPSLPQGAKVKLTGAGATPAIEATMGAGGFALAPVPVVTDTYAEATFVLQATADAGIAVRSAVPPRVGDHLRFNNTTFAPITAVENPSGDTYVLRFANATAVTNLNQKRFGLCAVESAGVVASRFSISVLVDGVQAEPPYAGLSLSEQHPRYYAKDDVVNDTSELIRVSPRAGGAPAVSLASMPSYVTTGAGGPGGADVPATNADFRDGLTKLEAVPEPAMVIVPDSVKVEDPLLQADLVSKVITHCENFRRFAIVDAPDHDDDNDQELLDWRNTTVSSTYAAVYAPHLKIVTVDPDSIDRFTTVPPSGFVAGTFARTDRLRGVHKAPGNETVTGIVGLAHTYTQRRQDLLNPGGVNLIRAFRGRGTRLWGARNATDDTTWRYVNVRRLFNMIEISVDQATQWVVFEPNTAQTWIRVKVSVENFLDQQWRAGALAGTKPEQAYRVRVGLGETMTETDIDLGLIITEVAIAPAKPAEFVVFRFSHKRLSE